MARVIDCVPEIVQDLYEQLKSDEKRWGNAWLKKTKEGQEGRIFDDFFRYYQEWIIHKRPIPWLKIIGNSVIALIREKHPELFPK